MFYNKYKKVFVGIIIGTPFSKFENSECSAEFSLSSPLTIKLFSITFNAMVEFLASYQCKLSNQVLFHSINELTERVRIWKDVYETIKMLVPKGYDMEK